MQTFLSRSKTLSPLVFASLIYLNLGCSQAPVTDDSKQTIPTAKEAAVSKEATLPTQPIRWEVADLIGKHFILKSDDGGVEHSRFQADGMALITIIKVPGGPPVAPLLYWKIDAEGTLLLSVFEDMSEPNKHKLLARNGNKYTVDRNGKSYVLEVESSK